MTAWSTPRSVTDRLLETAGHGDLDALGCLYDHTAPLIYGLVRASVPDEATATQITQRVYLQAWRCAPGYDPVHASAMGMLLACARRHLTDFGGPPLRRPAT